MRQDLDFEEYSEKCGRSTYHQGQHERTASPPYMAQVTMPIPATGIWIVFSQIPVSATGSNLEWETMEKVVLSTGPLTLTTQTSQISTGSISLSGYGATQYIPLVSPVVGFFYLPATGGIVRPCPQGSKGVNPAKRGMLRVTSSTLSP